MLDRLRKLVFGQDDIADLRPGLGKLVKRAKAVGATEELPWLLDLKDCKIRGENFGHWRVIVQPIQHWENEG